MTRFLISAMTAAAWQARLSWRVDIGCSGKGYRTVPAGLSSLTQDGAVRRDRGRSVIRNPAQTQPPSLMAATAELASIADAGKAWHGPRRSATSPR